MAFFAVTLVAGRHWDRARGRRQQRDWDQHARFMESLVEDGLIVLGGPVGTGDEFLLAVDAYGEHEIRDRLGDDPWADLGIIRIGSIRPWALWLDGRESHP